MKPVQPLTPEAQALAASHLELARKMARKFARRVRRPDLIDLFESNAYLGLCQAARSFDPSRGFRFATLAGRRILGALFDDARSIRHGGRRNPVKMHSIDRPILDPGCSHDFDPHAIGDRWRWGDLAPPDPAGSDGAAEAELESLDFVEALLRQLPPQHREALRGLYLDASGGNGPRVGAKLGVGESRVCQVHREALRLIREGDLVVRCGG